MDKDFVKHVKVNASIESEKNMQVLEELTDLEGMAALACTPTAMRSVT